MNARLEALAPPVALCRKHYPGLALCAVLALAGIGHALAIVLFGAVMVAAVRRKLS